MSRLRLGQGEGESSLQAAPGEHRGVEVILVGLNVSIEGSQCHVSAEAGIADRNSRMLLMLDATIELP